MLSVSSPLQSRKCIMSWTSKKFNYFILTLPLLFFTQMFNLKIVLIMLLQNSIMLWCYSFIHTQLQVTWFTLESAKKLPSRVKLEGKYKIGLLSKLIVNLYGMLLLFGDWIIIIGSCPFSEYTSHSFWLLPRENWDTSSILIYLLSNFQKVYFLT